MIIEAIALAKKAHAGQIRKFTSEAYIVHPARVAMQVSLLGYADEEMIAAAWLHDVLEDTTTTYAQIVSHTNENVYRLVKELTFDEANLSSLTYEQKKQVQNAHTAQASRRAKSIKILDRLDNLEDFARSVESGECKLEKLERYCKVSWELQKLLGSQDDKQVDGDLVYRLRIKLCNLEKRFNLNGVVV